MIKRGKFFNLPSRELNPRISEYFFAENVNNLDVIFWHN